MLGGSEMDCGTIRNHQVLFACASYSFTETTRSMINPRMDQLRFCLVVSTTDTCGLPPIGAIGKPERLLKSPSLKEDACVNWAPSIPKYYISITIPEQARDTLKKH